MVIDNKIDRSNKEMSKALLFAAFAILFFSGCSVLSLGENETRYEELGWDYSDAGVPASPIWTLFEREEAHKRAYQEIKQ
jgi:hypothetical protein